MRGRSGYGDEEQGAGKEASTWSSHFSRGRCPPWSWTIQGSVGAADSPQVLLMSVKGEAAQRFGGTVSSSEDWVQSCHQFCLQTEADKR